MDRLKKTISVLCAVFIPILVLASSPLVVNTYVGSKPGNFFDPASTPGGICTIIALFAPFILTIIVFLLGLVFGKYKMIAVFTGTVSVFSVTHLFAPFIVSFIFTSDASNAFAKFMQAFFTVLAMPANSLAYAFNESINLYLTDFGGSRILVFIVTFLTFLAPVIFTAGYLTGSAAQDKQQQEERFA